MHKAVRKLRDDAGAAPVDTTGEITDQAAESLADQILSLQVSSETQVTGTVGQLLFMKVYAGNESLYHSTDPTKGQSLAKIAAQPGMADAHWGKTSLHNAIGVGLLSKALGGFAQYPHLLVSDYVAVLGLDLARQKSLLSQAESGRWTVAQLEKAAGKKSGSTAHAQGAQVEISPPPQAAHRLGRPEDRPRPGPRGRRNRRGRGLQAHRDPLRPEHPGGPHQ